MAEMDKEMTGEGSDDLHERAVDVLDIHAGVDCALALQRLYDYLDSEMTPSDVERIKAHVESCGTCFKEYDLEEHLKTLIKRSCCEKAPDDLRLRIMAQIKR